jgi:hypothetical protein
MSEAGRHVLELCFALWLSPVAAILVAATYLEWARANPKPPPPKPARSPMKVCKGCGDTYHEDWGWICPNCSGAD